MSSLSKLSNALLCPVCDPKTHLVAPITLRCGHTLCSEHVIPTNDSPTINASSTPSGLSKALWSSCPFDSCNPAHSRFPHSMSSDHKQITPDKLESLHSYHHPCNPKVTFLPSRESVFEDQRSVCDEKKLSEGIKPLTDILVSKLLALAERYRNSILSLDSLSLQNRPGSFTSFGGKGSPVPQSSDTSTDLTPTSTEDVPDPLRKEVWAGLRVTDEDNTPSSETDDILIQDLHHELTCEICLSLLYKPITTPCQHVSDLDHILPPNQALSLMIQTFCSTCLARSLDHSDRCPLCRQDLFGYAYFQGHSVNKLVI